MNRLVELGILTYAAAMAIFGFFIYRKYITKGVTDSVPIATQKRLDRVAIAVALIVIVIVICIVKLLTNL